MNERASQPAGDDAATPLHSATVREARLATGSTADLSGKQLGDYQILRRLGRGGMAEVYLAQQESLRRQVALKILRSHLADDNAYVRRFHREAQAAASLVHANIVQIYEVGNVAGFHYIAQEYVAGRNLRQHLQQCGPVELPMAMSIMRQVAAALYKAAAQQIVHRDIKPENIMLTSDGEVKVADFGLARVADDSEAMHLTTAGITLGTPLYMSPEQVESGKVDCRSDIYSFGVTCYHMLTGRPPFEGETALVVALKHAQEQPAPLAELRADLPQPLLELVHDMLAKRPADRPQSPGEILRRLRDMQVDESNGWGADLEPWSGPELLAATRESSATQQLQNLMQAASQARRQARPRWQRWAAAIVAALLLGGTAAGLSAPDDLLQYDPDDLAPITRQPSPELQYGFAGVAPENVERAYQSVAEYYPAHESPVNARYVRLSKMRLFELYFEAGNLESAWREASDLAASDPTERDAQAFGLAAQVLVLNLRGQRSQMSQKLAELMPITDALSPKMKERLAAAGIQLTRDDS